jgi:hypothetical protein
MISKHSISSLFCGRTIEDTYFFCLVSTQRLWLYETFIYSLWWNFAKLLSNPVFCNCTLNTFEDFTFTYLNKNRNVVLFLATKASCYWHCGSYSVSVYLLYWHHPQFRYRVPRVHISAPPCLKLFTMNHVGVTGICVSPCFVQIIHTSLRIWQGMKFKIFFSFSRIQSSSIPSENPVSHFWIVITINFGIPETS